MQARSAVSNARGRPGVKRNSLPRPSLEAAKRHLAQMSNRSAVVSQRVNAARDAHVRRRDVVCRSRQW